VEGVSPRTFASRLLRRTWLSESALEIELERPEELEFTAGQSIRVIVGEEGRDYSLTSGPSEGSLSLCVRLVEGGAVSPVVAGATLGTSLNFTGPHGAFLLRASPRPIVWAATGVGIAPFLSMVRAGATGFTLLHGVRRIGELFRREELEAAASRYVPCLSRESASGCFPGRITGWAAQQLGPGTYDFYLCGNRRMVRDFLILVDERFPRSHVYTEIFF
jgi:ferredoxin-NADP reductase